MSGAAARTAGDSLSVCQPACARSASGSLCLSLTLSLFLSLSLPHLPREADVGVCESGATQAFGPIQLRTLSTEQHRPGRRTGAGGRLGAAHAQTCPTLGGAKPVKGFPSKPRPPSPGLAGAPQAGRSSADDFFLLLPSPSSVNISAYQPCRLSLEKGRGSGGWGGGGQPGRKIKIEAPQLILKLEQPLWSKRELCEQGRTRSHKVLRLRTILCDGKVLIGLFNTLGHHCKAAELGDAAVIMRARWRALIGSLLVRIIPPVFTLAPSCAAERSTGLS